MQEMKVQSLVWEDLLEKRMATHSSILAWEILRTEEPGRPQSLGSQKSDKTEQLNHHHHPGQGAELPPNNHLKSCVEVSGFSLINIFQSHGEIFAFSKKWECYYIQILLVSFLNLKNIELYPSFAQFRQCIPCGLEKLQFYKYKIIRPKSGLPVDLRN